MGLLFDPKLNAYFTTGIRGKHQKHGPLRPEKGIPFGHSLWRADQLAEVGIYDRRTKKVFDDFTAYQNARPPRGSQSGQNQRPWVGIIFHRNSVESGQTQTVDAVIEALEERDFNVLPIYGPFRWGRPRNRSFRRPGSG